MGVDGQMGGWLYVVMGLGGLLVLIVRFRRG